jgi:hypothetical protein
MIAVAKEPVCIRVFRWIFRHVCVESLAE